jgi:hypothetical protein
MSEPVNTNHFCTLFDSNYLSRGLTMYLSLKNTGADFHLYVFAFDDKCLQVLQKMQLPNLTVISLAQFEDAELLRVKPTRTRAEYCWTSTSSTILYCIEQFNLPACTYLDADMFFYTDPAILIDELGDNSVIITEHRYTPRYDKTKLSGKYCVQFVTFKNDERGLTVLRWWRNACLEWCYNRHEEGKFGDQKYLDDWATRFEGVHVLQHLGGGLALWNIQQYKAINKRNRLVCQEPINGTVFAPVFYHFHYLKYFTNGTVELGRRLIGQDILHEFYIPYLKKMEEAKQLIAQTDDSFDAHGAGTAPTGMKQSLLKIYRKMKNVYHIYNLEELLNTV